MSRRWPNTPHSQRIESELSATARGAELRIAAVIGADGIRPYRSRYGHQRSKSFEWSLESLNPAPTEKARRAAGQSDAGVRFVLRALPDAGLAEVQLGPRGGFTKVRCAWTHRAFLAPSGVAPADEEALGELA